MISKLFPKDHKVLRAPGTKHVNMYHTDVAATFKRIRREQAAASAVVVLPALVVDDSQLVPCGPFLMKVKG